MTRNPDFKRTPSFDVNISETAQGGDIVTMKYRNLHTHTVLSGVILHDLE